MNPLDEPIFCGAAVILSPTVTGEFMYMPGGVQTISPIAGGLKDKTPIRVLVDASSAAQLEAQRSALVAKNKPPYLDFNHEDGPASAWVKSFVWREQPEPGVYCQADWTGSGRRGVEEREWRQFSPVFHIDNKRGNPARVICQPAAKPNMGGLVNNPAFHEILPLWAKDAGAASESSNQPTEPNLMTTQALAALQAKINSLEQEVSAIRAKNDDTNASELRAKNAELAAAKADLATADAQAENEALKAKNQSLEGEAKTRKAADAKAAVVRAVERGAIAAKDTTSQESFIVTATENPSFIAAIDGLQGSTALGGRITTPGTRIIAEAPAATMKAYAAILARNSQIPLSHETRVDKGALGREAYEIFAKDIDKNTAFADMSMTEAVRAADNPDVSVGLLSGTLVLSRSLPLLQYQYPILTSITTDFSDAPGLFNQTESTRITMTPAVQERSTAVDSAGRPLGWTTTSPAQMVDVQVTLNHHYGIPVVFGQNILASTVRNLFAEQAPQALYALGGTLVKLITGLFTPANYNGYANTQATGGATTSGSTTITVADSTVLYPGQAISGTGIPTNAYVAKILSGTTAQLTQAATATNAGLTFTLGGGKLPTTYASYVKALADFGNGSLGDIKAAFDINEVSMEERFLLLNASYYARLGQDPALNTFFAATRMPEIITKGSLPPVQGFQPMNAPWLPTANNLVGFAGHRASAILKTRLPNDITSAVGSQIPGSVTTVSVPGGISVLLVQYQSLREGYAEWRPEIMAGSAVGDTRTGLCLTSA